MRVDLRVKHDIVARKAAIGLFERGHGSESAAKALSVPRDTVRQWLYVYRSFGSEVLLSMDGKQARYTYEQKVAAASAVVDGGMTQAGRHGGVRGHVPDAAQEMVRALPRGRRGGPAPEAQGPAERFQGEAAHARAGARGALPKARGRGGLPKKIARPGREGRTLTRAKAEAVSGPARRGARARVPAGVRRPGEVELLLRAVAPEGPPGPSSGRPPPRYSRAPPTGAATGRSPCACAPSGACA